MAKTHQNMFARGSAPWSIKRYKEQTLLAFEIDLRGATRSGIEEDAGRFIQDALALAIARADEIPNDSRFYLKLWEDLELYRGTFERWNELPRTGLFEHEEGRHFYLKELRNIRLGMWSFFKNDQRRGSQQLDDQLDAIMRANRRLFDDMHFAFRPLITTYLSIFPALAKCLYRYQKAIAKFP